MQRQWNASNVLMSHILKKILPSRKPMLFNLIRYYVRCTDLTKNSVKLTLRKKETDPFDLLRHFLIDNFTVGTSLFFLSMIGLWITLGIITIQGIKNSKYWIIVSLVLFMGVKFHVSLKAGQSCSMRMFEIRMLKIYLDVGSTK